MLLTHHNSRPVHRPVNPVPPHRTEPDTLPQLAGRERGCPENLGGCTSYASRVARSVGYVRFKFRFKLMNGHPPCSFRWFLVHCGAWFLVLHIRHASLTDRHPTPKPGLPYGKYDVLTADSPLEFKSLKNKHRPLALASIRLANTVCDASRQHTRESWDAEKAEQAPSTLPLPQRSNPVTVSSRSR